MTKQVTVEELREKLDEVLAEVKSGESVEITDAGTTIAAMRPTIVRRGVKFPFRDFDWGPRPKGLDIDPAQVIIDERDRERSLKKYGL